MPVAKCGLSSVGACHQRTFSGPPPPRRAGVNAGALGWAAATPADASIWAARGAANPRPTMVWTKARRVSRPAFTRLINSFNACSSMGILLRLGQVLEASMRTATSIASSMLSGLAMPFQARSKAVPWSTDTRRNGRPTVTLTPDRPVQVPLFSS